MIDWENFFKPEDFKDVLVLEEDDIYRKIFPHEIDMIISVANRKLWMILQCEQKVYGNTKFGAYHGVPTIWGPTNEEPDTHQGTLIDLKKL